MDTKYLEEIKARLVDADIADDWDYVNSRLVYQDIPALVAEVERLTARLQESPYGDDKIDELEEACDNLRFQIGSKDQQIATLKKAMELMSRTASLLRKIVSGEYAPVVRCGKCYKRNTSWCPLEDWTLPHNNDFCSYGERKDEQN